MSTVRFIGLNTFDSTDQSIIKTLCTRYMEKLERDLNPQFKLSFHCKRYRAQGKPKHSFHARIQMHTKLIVHSQATDWDLRRTVHKVMQKLERELQHKYKTEGQPQERLRSKRGTSLKQFSSR